MGAVNYNSAALKGPDINDDYRITVIHHVEIYR